MVFFPPEGWSLMADGTAWDVLRQLLFAGAGTAVGGSPLPSENTIGFRMVLLCGHIQGTQTYFWKICEKVLMPFWRDSNCEA